MSTRLFERWKNEGISTANIYCGGEVNRVGGWVREELGSVAQASALVK